MKGNFTVVIARPNAEKHGEDTGIGVSIKLKGVVDEEFATRFLFGSETGVAPDEVKGVLSKMLWTGDHPNFLGLESIKSNNKIDFDVKVGDITLNEATVSKAVFIPSVKPGYFGAEFQVYKSDFKDGQLEELSWLMKQEIDCSFYLIQKDIEEE